MCVGISSSYISSASHEWFSEQEQWETWYSSLLCKKRKISEQLIMYPFAVFRSETQSIQQLGIASNWHAFSQYESQSELPG